MKMRKSGWIKIIIGVALLAGVAFFWTHNHKTTDAAKNNPPVSVTISQVTLQSVPLDVPSVGTVVPYESVGVKSRIDSQITEIHIKDGDSVRKGDLLFVLDARTLGAQRRQFQANAQRDKAQLTNARLQFDRAQKLFKQGFATRASLEQSRAALESAEANVAASMANVENIQAQLDYTRITAPVSGRTGTIHLSSGNTVRPSDATPLVTINQISPIRVESTLAQKYLPALQAALKQGPVLALVKNENGTANAEGRVEYVDNSINQATGTFALRAHFQNSDEALWPGMFVNLAIRLTTDKDAVTVPASAVQHAQDGDFLFTIASCKAVKKPVTVERINGNIAIISKGIQANEWVVIDGLLGLNDASPVTIAGNADCQPNVDKK